MVRSAAAAVTVVVTLALTTLFFCSAAAYSTEPASLSHDVEPLETVDRLELGALDVRGLLLEDEDRELQGLAPRYAVPSPVSLSPATAGSWEALDNGTRLWRLRVTSPGALSINFGFAHCSLPDGAALFVYASDGSYVVGPFTSRDNENHGELWTPVVLSDDVVIELAVPVKALGALELELASVNVGYRGFGELIDGRAGTCNIDVVCPEGDGWRDEIRSVAVISTGGSLFCTGFMVNNTAEDETPYFMTANHCGIDTGNAASLVVYWNFESPTCGQQGGGSLSDYQTGSYFRATSATSDFTLVELDDAPDPDHEVTFSGWDRSSADPTSATAIHHPSCDEKSISFEYDACTTTTYLNEAVPGDGTHIRVIDWDVGTTEPGSSGSPLFDQNHRIVGQLHGGYAACGNDESDWYGRLSVSWDGGGTSSTRLRDWLDPVGSGATSVDLLAPGATGMGVMPEAGFTAYGDVGGPFSPSSAVYALENKGATAISYEVTKTESWITVANASGTIPAYGTVDVTVSINSNANSLDEGTHSDVVCFTNLTDHDGDATRGVELRIGVPQLVYGFPMDSDPGWTTEGSWDFGQPTGGGGGHGGPDPSAGNTGPNVYGYNLSGDYTNNMSETHLTSQAIDCSDLSAVTLRFHRWLGVEQPLYDHAYVRVSSDGVSYTTVWENDVEVADTSWSQHELDISSVADGEETVYLRWTMGETDGSWTYCGWNIDDVEIWGLEESQTGVSDGLLTKAALSPNYPNPFGPSTAVQFRLHAEGPAALRVYDVAGRLVKTLEDGNLAAGPHLASWDGTDSSGARASSGVYFCRLETETYTETRRMVLLK